MARGRRLALRTAAGLALLAAAAGTWAALNWSHLQLRYASHRITSASSAEEREKWAERLLAHGDAGAEALSKLLDSDDPSVRLSAAAVLNRHVEMLVEGDPRAAVICGRLLDSLDAKNEVDCAVLLDILPAVLKRTGSGHAAKCREVVAAGLHLPEVERRLAAIRLALHPHLQMRADLLPLLNAPEAEIRRAALFAVGPATDAEPVIGDEELFRWLHDPDEGVRTVCVDALVSRGRTDTEIALGRRLMHPLASERLKLLLDLRYDEVVRDPEPWLERLSRDADGGVRAGAVRVAAELAEQQRLAPPPWVSSLAQSDPDPTVRRIALYYGRRAAGVNGLRTIGGP